MITVGSLFSGIGGLDLGLERAGMVISWQVEIDSFCQKVLAKHWPHVKRYGDIKLLDGSELEPVDLICGGFPCQPVSVAGKRTGVEDERWLWPEFARLLRVLRPRYVLIENVPGLLRLGMDAVLTDLAKIGYDAEWETISASAFGAPHQRKRVFVVAYSRRSHGAKRSEERGGNDAGFQNQFERPTKICGQSLPLAQSVYGKGRNGGEGVFIVAYANGRRCTSEQIDNKRLSDQKQHSPPSEQEWQFFQSRVKEGSSLANAECDSYFAQVLSDKIERQDAARPTSWFGGSAWWAVEPNVGRVANGVPARVDRLRGLGNAVVPQVVEWLGRQIMAFDELVGK